MGPPIGVQKGPLNGTMLLVQVANRRAPRARFARDVQLPANHLDRLLLNKISPAYLRDTLHDQHHKRPPNEEATLNPNLKGSLLDADHP